MCMGPLRGPLREGANMNEHSPREGGVRYSLKVLCLWVRWVGNPHGQVLF